MKKLVTYCFFHPTKQKRESLTQAQNTVQFSDRFSDPTLFPSVVVLGEKV